MMNEASQSARGAVETWTRRRLQMAVAAVLACGVLLVVGGVMAAVDLLDGQSAPSSPASASGGESGVVGSLSSSNTRDGLARAPMPVAPEDAALPGPLSAEVSGVLTLPSPTVTGDAGVPTGFPQTIEGAVAQLAAINQSALEAGTLQHAQDVIGGWAQPGGPGPETWSGIAAVVTLLAAAEVPADGDASVQVGFTPSTGLVKGALDQDGGQVTGDSDRRPVFVVPCVVHVLTVSTRVSIERTAVADCQRMVWLDADPSSPDGEESIGRWVIDAGPEPVPPPSIWPGTQESIDAGYLWLDQPAVPAAASTDGEGTS